MEKYIIITFLTVFVLLTSCKEKVIRHYYDTGELQTEKICIKGNDSISYFKLYYKNGNIATEGTVKSDSIRNGHWKIYFADGKLIWEGEIENRIVLDECKFHWEDCAEKRFKYCEIKGNPDILKVGETYKFRVIMPDLHPEFYMLFDEKFQSLENTDLSDYETYPWTFTPTKEGTFIVRMLFADKNGYFITGNPEFIFDFNPIYPLFTRSCK